MMESNANEEIWCSVVLPDDVVVEILARLPPKPFFRFKCVSKSWHALSSHASRLNKLLQPTLQGFFYGSGSKSPLWCPIGFANITGTVNEVDGTLSALPHHAEFDILDCCNGLLLIKCWDFRTHNPFSSDDMYVYNPTTRKHVNVKFVPEKKFQRNERTFSLAFDPQDQSRFHVVCFIHSHSDEDVCANTFLTFSSDSRRWQQGGNLECDLNIANSIEGTFFGGMVHRVTWRRKLVSVDPIDNSYLVTKFDFSGLSDEDFSKIEQSQGRLHFMFVEKFHKMSIWVSENVNRKKWILKHQISLEDMRLVHAVCWPRKVKLHPEKDAL